jgi:site-specific DNA-methyltransferase (adenine-specific)
VIELHNGDCLEIMPTLAAGSADMILCDLPYGTTQNKWDSIIPLDKLWAEYRRICRGAIVLTASQPFTTVLIGSNLKHFKHAWVWEKSRFANQMAAKVQPLKIHEDVAVFCFGKLTYNPQGLVEINKVTKQGARVTDNIGGGTRKTSYVQTHTNYPRSVLRFASEGSTVHPTQKPVALFEYPIRTYTNDGETVLDNTMGSGTTGVACRNTGRKFIGIERDPDYFAVASARIHSDTVAAPAQPVAAANDNSPIADLFTPAQAGAANG